jgi:hypothetical protein
MTKPLPYEKALALKQAGWPQPEGDFFPGEFVCDRFDKDTQKWICAYSPALEELIDGCPKVIRLDDRDWTREIGVCSDHESHYATYSRNGVPHDDYWKGGDETAKEAVCDLWLSLPPELRVKP